MCREYFKNLTAEINEVVDMNQLELVVPEGFNKQLTSMEKHQLINDQLLEHGMMLHNFTIGGQSRIVEANKNSKHIERNPQISKRLREYLEKFNA